MPLGRRFVSLPHPEQRSLVERPADYLHADRQPRIREAARHRQRRKSRKCGRARVPPPSDVQPALVVTARLARRCLNLRRGNRSRRQYYDIVLLQRRHQLAPDQFPCPLRPQVCPRGCERRRLQPRACAPVVVVGLRLQPFIVVCCAVNIRHANKHRPAVLAHRQRHLLRRRAVFSQHAHRS